MQEAGGTRGALAGALRFAKLVALGFLGLLALLGILYVFAALKLGLLSVYSMATALVAFMGWIVYSTHRRDQAASLQPAKSLVESRLDVLDVLLTLVAWVLIAPLLDVGEAGSQGSDLGLLFGLGILVRWLRRRLLPWSVVRYHPRNLRLRTASVFCGLHLFITVIFLLTARHLEAPPLDVWLLAVATGVLAVLAAGLFLLEYRRQPREGE